MIYYHIRYNIYPAPGFPVEKEDWLILTKPHNEQQVKRLLIAKHQTNISLIVCSSICKEEYDLKTFASKNALSRKLQVSIKNIKEWKLAQPFNTLKKLKTESDALDKRYRNISEPFPLL